MILHSVVNFFHHGPWRSEPGPHIQDGKCGAFHLVITVLYYSKAQGTKPLNQPMQFGKKTKGLKSAFL